MLKIITILALIALQPTHQNDSIRNTAPLTNSKAEIIEPVAINLADTNKNTERKRPVPCSRRNSQSNPIDNPDEWLPTYKSGVIRPSNNINIIKILNHEHNIKNEDSVVKTEVFPYDPLVHKRSQQRVGLFLNPKNNYKPGRNLLLSDDDRVDGKNELLQHQAPSQFDISKEKLLEYPKSNAYLSENKTSQPDEIEILVKHDAGIQRERNVLVDSDYIKKLKEDIITESVQNLLNNSSQANLIIAKTDENYNPAYSNNRDKENNDCIPEEVDDDGYIKDNNSRRFLSDTIDIEDYNLDNNALENGSERKVYDNENEFIDPAKGVGIREMSLSGMSLLQHSRVCYACSTLNNPACWIPDRRTTVKYCRQGHQACVTKIFKSSQNKLIVTRDCGESCDDTDIPGPKYKSCSVCHTDMCNDTPNGASSLNKENFIISILTIFVIQCTV